MTRSTLTASVDGRGIGSLRPESSVPTAQVAEASTILEDYARLKAEFGFPALDEALDRLRLGLAFYESLSPKEPLIQIRMDDLYSLIGAANAFIAIVDEAGSISTDAVGMKRSGIDQTLQSQPYKGD